MTREEAVKNATIEIVKILIEAGVANEDMPAVVGEIMRTWMFAWCKTNKVSIRMAVEFVRAVADAMEQEINNNLN